MPNNEQRGPDGRPDTADAIPKRELVEIYGSTLYMKSSSDKAITAVGIIPIDTDSMRVVLPNAIANRPNGFPGASTTKVDGDILTRFAEDHKGHVIKQGVPSSVVPCIVPVMEHKPHSGKPDDYTRIFVGYITESGKLVLTSTVRIDSYYDKKNSCTKAELKAPVEMLDEALEFPIGKTGLKGDHVDKINSLMKTDKLTKTQVVNPLQKAVALFHNPDHVPTTQYDAIQASPIQAILRAPDKGRLL
jgi:hypothetical protein